jgi:hypothetical protein
MTRSLNFAWVAALTVGIVGFAARPAAAQDAGTDGSTDASSDAPAVPACSTLPNPIYLSGSTAFETTVKNFAVKFSALATNPMTVVYHLPGSCVGVDNITNTKDLTGTAHYYTMGATSITTNTCTLPASGQKADIGISDVFYASCTSVTPQPGPPAGIKDFPGPAQAMLFVVPKASTATYITALEAQDLYGCGAGFTGNMTPWTSTSGNFCRDPNSGTQITVATNVNIPASVMISPICVPETGTGGVVSALTMSAAPASAIGFISEDAYDPQRANLSSLAFQAFGQTLAYYSDSTTAANDRANVRDGHYGVWGYEHMLTTVDAQGNPTKANAADFIGYINGTKTDASFDYVAVEGKAGTIPVCAMKVQRFADGGPLSFSNVADTCGCAFETAAAAGVAPTTCTACTTGDGGTACAAGTSCHHGYCE